MFDKVPDNFSKWPTWRTIALFYNTFITVLYMFRATSWSSSGGQILLIQHLVWPLSISDRPMYRLRERERERERELSLKLCTGRSPTEMFRATSCSSTRSQIVLIQHLEYSVSVSGRPVHRLRERTVPQTVHRTATYREWPYQMLY